MDFAVIKSGGKQYKVKKGDKLRVEKLNSKEGDLVSFDVLLMADENGDKVEIGQPLLGKKIQGKILKQGRGKKIFVIKYKAKTRYRRNLGHRQLFTQIEIMDTKEQ